MGFLTNPRLPKNAVTDAVVSPQYHEILRPGLEMCGVSARKGPRCDTLSFTVMDHPDCTFCDIGGGTIITFMGCETEKTFSMPGLLIKLIDRPPHKRYPFDAVINVMILPGLYIHNKDITAPELRSELSLRGYRSVHVMQGYAACCAAIVDERSIITSDKGIADAAQREGLDVLLITPGYIALEGHDYGFIGGACGKLAPDILAFSGSLDEHPDKMRILSYLQQKGVKPIFLTKHEVFDCGGIVPLCEL